MKRVICFVLSVLLFLYGGCYLEKKGSNAPPTKDEFVDYVIDKKDAAVDVFQSIKDWVVSYVIES